MQKQKVDRKEIIDFAPETNVNLKVVNHLFSSGTDQNDYDALNDDYNSDEDQENVVNFDNELKFIKELRGVDIIFLIDTTASMRRYFKSVKRFIRKLMWDAQRCITQYLNDDDDVLRAGIVCYRDHPPQDMTYNTMVIDFTHDFIAFKETIKKLTAKGGGDKSESVLDGIHDALNKVSWRENSEKFIYHFSDAPPHGNEFSIDGDGFPNGCPCNNDPEELLLTMREMNIDYTIIKLSDDIDRMIEVFSSYHKVDVVQPNLKIDYSIDVDQK